ncbi:MAG: hypothetical protein M3Q27_08470 [Actinomycetota bacterium]|nr:hypothetical protein [Actinomycetota bacterium]
MARTALAGALVSALVVSAAPAHAAVVRDTPARTASVNGRVDAVAYRGSVLYLAGDFTSATDKDGTVRSRTRLAAIDTSTGRLLPWAPRADRAVRSLAVVGDAVYAGGDFSSVNGLRRVRLVKLNASSGAVASNFVHSAGSSVLALAAGDGRLYAGGKFLNIDGQSRARLAAFSLSSGALATGWKPRADSDVRGLRFAAGRLYVAGRFTSLNGSTARANLAALRPDTGAVDTSFAARLGYPAKDVAVTGNAVYVAADGPGGHLRKYALGGASRWDLFTDGGVQAVAVLDGVVYAGGHWTYVCPVTRTDGKCPEGMIQRRKLVAVTPEGNLLGWAPQANSPLGVTAMAPHPATGKLAVGGAFTTFKWDAVRQPHIALFAP